MLNVFKAIDGNWGEWTPWSKPLKGSTTVTRKRTCDSPVPQYDGSYCLGPDAESKDVVIRKYYNEFKLFDCLKYLK